MDSQWDPKAGLQNVRDLTYWNCLSGSHVNDFLFWKLSYRSFRAFLRIICCCLNILQLWSKEGNLGSLPMTMQKSIRKYEAEGSFNDPGYLAIVAHLSTQFMTRTFPVLDCINNCENTKNQRVYNTLWGPSEFYMRKDGDAEIGQLDLQLELRNISVPVLLIHGAFDTMRGPNIRYILQLTNDRSLLRCNEPLYKKWTFSSSFFAHL